MRPIDISGMNRILKTELPHINTDGNRIINVLKLGSRPVEITSCSFGDAYVDKLLEYMPEIIKAAPDRLEVIKSEFDNIVKPSEMKIGAHKAFRNSLIEIMQYDTKRNDFYPGVFKSLGIKACVYCNSQLTVCVDRPMEDNDDIQVKAKFQLDHYYPKSEYPCFSISLFNLYPVCASCNISKRSSYVSFILHQENEAYDPMIHGREFRIEDADLAECITDPNHVRNIKIKFREPPIRPNFKTFNNVFDIEGIYNTQLDLVEELIVKYKIYDDKYRESLVNSFPEIFGNVNLSGRMIIGNYTDESDIHKRPMSKFIQDIARQLKMI